MDIRVGAPRARGALVPGRSRLLVSVSGMDVSEVATPYGGGGHPAAAGVVTAPDWCGDAEAGARPEAT